MMQKALFILGIVFLGLSGAQRLAAEPTKLEIITIQHTQASELAEIVGSLVGEDGSIQAAPGNQLIIRSPASKMPEILEVIKKLDMPIVDLMVSVSFGLQQQSEDQEVWRTNTRRQQQGVRTVRVQAGQFARIEENKIVPFVVATSGSRFKREVNKSSAERPLADLASAKQLLAENQTDSNQLKSDLATKQKELRFETDPAQKQMLETDIAMLGDELKDLDKTRAGLESAVEVLSGKTKDKHKEVRSEYVDGHVLWDYQTLPSGLFVQPTVVGEKVQLVIIDKRSGSYHPQKGAETAYFESQMTVPYGEWVQIGSADMNQSTKKEAWNLSTRRDHTQQSEIWVKVDKTSQ